MIGESAEGSGGGFIRAQGLSGSGLGAFIGGVVYAVVVTVAVFVGLPVLLPQYTVLIQRVVVPVLAAGFAVLMALSLRSMRRGAVLQAWATRRGMRYIHQRRSTGPGPWAGTPFPRTGGHAVRHHVIGHGFEIARFRSLPDDSGYHSAGLFDAFTFVRFDLPTAVPHLVVTSNRSSALSAAGLAISGGRTLRGSIEFDSSFALHCPADYERDALYIFTPDVLALMIDAVPGCDLELIDTSAYLYSSREPRLWIGPAADEVLEVVALLRRKLDRQTRRYTDDRATGIVTLAGARTVAVGGRRLENRRNARGWAVAAGLALPAIVLTAAFVAHAVCLIAF